jgi:ribonuclease P protein component
LSTEPDSPSHGQSFPRAQRLTRGTELEIVRHRGKRTRTSSIDVRAIASLRAFPRVGFVVPRYKHSAVDRNRLKRRLRELVRLELLPSLPPMDVVLRAAPHAYGRDFDALREEIRKAGRQLAGLTLPPPPDA